jgi:hypothetical protein
MPLTATDLLSRNRGPFDVCYTKARQLKPDLGRTSIDIAFSIDDEGKLFAVELTYRNRMDDDSKACMKAAAEALTFPPTIRGKQTGTIRFPP